MNLTEDRSKVDVLPKGEPTQLFTSSKVSCRSTMRRGSRQTWPVALYTRVDAIADRYRYRNGDRTDATRKVLTFDSEACSERFLGLRRKDAREGRPVEF